MGSTCYSRTYNTNYTHIYLNMLTHTHRHTHTRNLLKHAYRAPNCMLHKPSILNWFAPLCVCVRVFVCRLVLLCLVLLALLTRFSLIYFILYIYISTYCICVSFKTKIINFLTLDVFLTQPLRETKLRFCFRTLAEFLRSLWVFYYHYNYIYILFVGVPDLNIYL